MNISNQNFPKVFPLSTRSDALKLPVFSSRNKEKWNFLIAGSSAVGGFGEQWVFLLNDMLYRFWNLSNQWLEKRKLWSSSNSSSICLPRLTNQHLFTGFPWCLIAVHSLYSFSSIDECAAWRPHLPDRVYVLRACIFSIRRTQVLTWKDRNGITSQLWAKKLQLLGFNKKI